MMKIIYIIVLVVILIVLFLAIKPTQKNNNGYEVQTKSFNLVVRDNKLISGQNVLKVNQGDSIVIEIISDVDGELHLHGYDKHVDFEKDKKAKLNFNANISGRFTYELEDTKTDLGVLEVSPK